MLVEQEISSALAKCLHDGVPTEKLTTIMLAPDSRNTSSLDLTARLTLRRGCPLRLYW